MTVRVDLNISLDGFATTTDGTPENPLGQDWFRLVDAYTATRTFRERVLGITDGSGTTGVDERYAANYFVEVGAEIMGANMFGFGVYGDDPDWRGWWGENPPFHVPVFVLTHRQKESLVMEGGTVFHFVTGTPEQILARALETAGDLDVRIGGGPTTVREYLKRGLVDELHVAIAPIILGDGIRLWDELRGLEKDYDATAEAAESGTLHVTYRRKS